MAALNVYSTEPSTNGKVVLKTSVGPLDVETWPREAPKAVRNFIQLCLGAGYPLQAPARRRASRDASRPHLPRARRGLL